MSEKTGTRFVSTDDTYSVAMALEDISKYIFDAYLNHGKHLTSFSVYKEPTTGAYNYYLTMKDWKHANK